MAIAKIHKKFPEIKLGIAEYGAEGCISHQKEDFERPEPFKGKFFPEQYQTYYHENAWNDILVNGIKIGSKTKDSKEFIFEWENIQLNKGTNSIEVTGYKEGEKYEDHCSWSY